VAVLVAVLGGVLLRAGEAAGDDRDFVTHALDVTGAVEHPLHLAVEDLRKYPRQELASVPITTHDGRVSSLMTDITGARLRDIVQSAAIVAPGRNDLKKMIVVAGASDGYRVVFSWSELSNSKLGDGVLVVYESGGKALSDHEGRIALVSTFDTRTGPRHVRWLQSIEVRRIAD